MTEISNKELIEKLEQIHKLSDLSNIESIVKDNVPGPEKTEISEVLKIKAQIRGLTERVEVLEKKDEQNIISLPSGDLREKKAQKKD